MSKGTIQIDVRAKGLYFIIDNPENGEKVTRQDILKLVEKYEITGIDFAAVAEIFREDALHIEKWVSSMKKLVIRSETMSVEVRNDNMEATICFHEPGYGGKLLDFDTIMWNLKMYYVISGIMEDVVRDLIKEKEYEKKYIVAVGQPPIDGTDGCLVYKVDTDSKNNRPRILPDGLVDYKQAGYFQMVEADQVLVEKIFPIYGKDGINVMKRVVSHKAAKNAPPFPKGRNIFVSEDGKFLMAQRSGQLVFQYNRVNVSDFLEVFGDVAGETGNIDFDGSVRVHGNVLTGFAINATGNVEIKGTVEGAKIIAGGDVHIYSGVQGSNKAVITSGGDMFTKFTQNATLNSGGDIVSNSIIHCEANCDGSILLEGKNSQIIGGAIIVRHLLRACMIGSAMATATDIKVGNAPVITKKYEKMKKDYAEVQKKFAKAKADADAILNTHKFNELTMQKKVTLVKLMHTKKELRESLVQCEKELARLIGAMEKENGRVEASVMLYSGVKLLIGNAILYVRDDIPAANLTNVDGSVAVEKNV